MDVIVRRQGCNKDVCYGIFAEQGTNNYFVHTGSKALFKRKSPKQRHQGTEIANNMLL